MTTWEAIVQHTAVRSSPLMVARLIKKFLRLHPDSVVTHEPGSNIFEVYYHDIALEVVYGFSEFQMRANGTLWN